MGRTGISILMVSSGSAFSRMSFSVTSALFPDVDWTFQPGSSASELAETAARVRPNLLISYLNPLIIPGELIQFVNGRAFNIHPGMPDFPGRDPGHFAFYEGATIAGATSHWMQPKVDSGDIIGVLSKSVDRSAGVSAFIDSCNEMSLALMIRSIPELISLREPTAKSRYEWRRENKRSRKDFLTACRIDSTMSAEEVDRRVEAFSVDGFRNVYTEIAGIRFYCETKRSETGP